MNLAGVMDDLGAALAAVPDLRVFPYWTDRLTPPAAIVSFASSAAASGSVGRARSRCTSVAMSSSAAGSSSPRPSACSAIARLSATRSIGTSVPATFSIQPSTNVSRGSSVAGSTSRM